MFQFSLDTETHVLISWQIQTIIMHSFDDFTELFVFMTLKIENKGIFNTKRKLKVPAFFM